MGNIKSYATIVKYSVILILAGAIAFVIWHFGIDNGKELKIDKTANVVEKVRNIGEFTSACYYEEMVLKSQKRSDFNDNLLGKLSNKISDGEYTDEIVIIANGKVRAGFDLSDLAENNIMVNGDTLSLVLSPVKIFDVIINPSGYEIYVEHGNWKHDEVAAIQSQAIEKLNTNAAEYGLLAKAEKSGLQKLKQLFMSLGFSDVHISVNNN